MRTNFMGSSRNRVFSCSFAICVGIVLCTTFASVAKADVRKMLSSCKEVDLTDKTKGDTSKGYRLTKEGGAATIAELTKKVYVTTLERSAIEALERNLSLPTETIAQVRVKTKDGRQYFLVLLDTVAYKCEPGTKLLVNELFNPLEPVIDATITANPCCTTTYGGDAQAIWYNLVNCPMSRPIEKAAEVCGH